MKKDQKFSNDTLWASLVFFGQALAGAAINILLPIYGKFEHLGAFNQYYAFFVISSHFMTLGHMESVQKHVSEYSVTNSTLLGAIIKSAYKNTLIFSLLLSLLLLILLYFFVPAVWEERITLFLIPALIFFGINKITLGILNGRREIKIYSLLQLFRAAGFAVVVLLVSFFSSKVSLVSISFFLVELLLFLLCCRSIYKDLAADKKKNEIHEWQKKHFQFGLKAFPQSFFAEAFIKIDVLVLSLFLGPKEIGVYSFASFFFEGIFQISYLFRVITNPILVKCMINKSLKDLYDVSIQSMKKSLSSTAIVSLGTLIFFAYFSEFFEIPNRQNSYDVLKILLPGLVVYSFFSPIDNLLLQGGRPGFQSLYMFVIIMINILLNFFLIPSYSLLGAALATSISVVISGPINLLLCQKVFLFKSWNNT